MMSQTVEYALRAMRYLASLDGAPVNCQTIAAQTRVPPGYLSKVMRDLVVAQLVTSFRGPNGGFVLARPPEQITMLDVVNAVDPIVRIQACPVGDPRHVRLCALHQRLDDALAAIERTFREATLAEMLRSDGEQGQCCAILPPGDVTLERQRRHGT
jgi:Rrf2 family nitric oxide-sensitive transcriptional repressor